MSQNNLVDIELDYVMGEMTIGEIALKYGISPDDLQIVAQHQGWPPSGVHLCNQQRQRFVDEYLVDLKPHLAARRAGYASPEAHVRLMRTPEVLQAIQARMRARAARVRIDQDAVIAELAKVALSNVRDLFDINGNLKPLHELPEEVSAAIQSVEVVEGKNEVLSTKKIRMYSKLDALKTMAQHHGLLTEKLEVTGKDGAPLVPEMSEQEAARRVAFLLAKAARGTGM